MKTRFTVLLKQALFLLFLFPVAVSAQKLNSKDKKTVAQLRTDIAYLASDALGGRLTGSPGQQSAAEYIIKAFQEAKLQPMGEQNDWYQNFEITQLRIANSGSMLLIDTKSFKVFEDFYPISYSADQANAQGLLFNAGKGISAPELNHNDYANAAGAQGKVFLIDIASPDSNKAHGKFAQYDLHYRIETAIKMGASAVLLVNSDPANTPNPEGTLEPRIKPMDKAVFFIKGYTADSLMKAGQNVLLRSDILTLKATGKNVIGFYDNKAPTTVIIGAHYDHLGMGEMGGSRTKETGLIHNGADDNASGTAALMELARRVSKDKKLKRHNYLFIAFSGEEEGLLGSNHFVKHPTYPLEKVAYMINMDMVGRLDTVTGVLMVNGVGTSPSWKPAMQALLVDSIAAGQPGLKIKTSEGGMGSSDHTSFYLNNIAAVHFFTGQHYDYHMPSDDAELINYVGEVKVINYIQALMQKLDAEERLSFTKTKDEETGRTSFKVTLGIMPDYVYSDDGVRIDGVTDGKPAAKAGIQKGDIILQLGNIPVHTMQDYMKALGSFSKGETTKVKIRRGTEDLELTVQF